MVSQLETRLQIFTDFLVTDTLTSSTSTAPYSVDDLEKMLSLANSLKGEVLLYFSC